jgi:hypothetical protein
VDRGKTLFTSKLLQAHYNVQSNGQEHNRLIAVEMRLVNTEQKTITENVKLKN